MKVLLIQPPVRDFYETAIRTQPIGLAYLGASLRSHGFDVEILDARTAGKRSVPVPAELSYLKDFYPFGDRSPFRLYTGYYHFGMGWKEIQQKVEASNADVFGISSSFTPYHQEALEIAARIKRWDSRKTVIMGGAHVSCDPEGVLRSPWIDYIVLGEGEMRLPLLLEKIARDDIKGLEGIDGIGYRADGQSRIQPLHSFIDPLDRLSYPARDLLSLDRYHVGRRPSTMIITSRGCPHGCAYCSAHLLMGTSFRTRSPESILQEMVVCRDRYGIELFDIEDDNFTFDRRRAKRLMELIIKTFGERTLELTAMNGVSFASLDEELLRLMKRAGFRTVNLSLVSTDPLTKERLGRPTSGRSFDEVLRDVEKASLDAIVYAILGMPDQTIDEMVDTVITLMGKRVLIGPSIYYPTPGTPLFEKCKTGGILPAHPSQWRSSAFPLETGRFDRSDLVTLFRLARAIHFVKRKMDQGELEEGTTWRGLSKIIKEKVGGKGDSGFTWLHLLMEKRSFFGLKKDASGKTVMFNVTGSKRVLDHFFDMALEKPILGSRSS